MKSPRFVLASLLSLVLISSFGFAQQSPTIPAPPAQDSTQPPKPDHAASYYHYSMAHLYEEMIAMYGRAEYVNKAIEEYRKAIEADPSSDFLNAGLVRLYALSGRIRDAVLEAQEILKRNPNNVEARKILGRIYLRSLGDMQSGSQSRDVLRLAIEQYEAIIRLEPNDSDDHLLLGRLYLVNKDVVKAEDQFRTAVKLDPTSEDAVTQLSGLLVDEGRAPEALKFLGAVPEASRTSKIYSAQGAVYEQLKDYKNAITSFKMAVDADQDNLDARRGLAENLANDNQIEAALDQYKFVADADPQDPSAALHISEIYRRMGKFDLAFDSLKKAEGVAQDLVEISYNEAIVLQAQGKYDDAASTLQALLDRTAKPDAGYDASERNNRGLFLERLGDIYRDSGKTQQAIETFHKMVDLGGAEQISHGYLEIIETYREQKQWVEATQACQEGVKRLPHDRLLKIELAKLLADQGRPEEGIQMVRAQLKGTPEDRETYVQLSQVYARLKRWKEAEDAISQAEKFASRPEDRQEVEFAQASYYERQKKYDQAEQVFRKLLQQDPNDTQTLNYLGYMLADRSTHLEEALSLVKRAVNLDPQNGAYLDSLGWVYFKMGNYDQAEESLRRAADKTPNDATVQDHLGELYAKTGKLKLAAAHWERALDEWAKSVPADVEQQDVARVQKKLESTRVKLAQQQQQH